VYDTAGSKIAMMNGQTLTKGFVKLPTGATAVYQASGLSWYRHADNLGSSRLATTPTRIVAADRAYAPYGEAFNETGLQDRSFAGHDEETITGLYDAPARQYSQNQGRWLSADPLGSKSFQSQRPQAMNRYAYVSNNPLLAIDASGLYEGDCDDDYWWLGDLDFVTEIGDGGGREIFCAANYAPAPPPPAAAPTPTPTFCDDDSSHGMATAPSAGGVQAHQADVIDMGERPKSCGKAKQELEEAIQDAQDRLRKFLQYGAENANYGKSLEQSLKRLQRALAAVTRACKCEIGELSAGIAAIGLIERIAAALAEFCIMEPEVCLAPAF
jgi:RHS repeat-associated protein